MALRVEDAEGCAPVAGVCVAWDSADCRSPLPRAFVPSAVRSDAARGEEVEREAHAAEHVDSGVVEGGKDLYMMMIRLVDRCEHLLCFFPLMRSLQKYIVT